MMLVVGVRAQVAQVVAVVVNLDPKGQHPNTISLFREAVLTARVNVESTNPPSPPVIVPCTELFSRTCSARLEPDSDVSLSSLHQQSYHTLELRYGFLSGQACIFANATAGKAQGARCKSKGKSFHHPSRFSQVVLSVHRCTARVQLLRVYTSVV
eukprot:2843440-Amphidinium_carterae.2